MQTKIFLLLKKKIPKVPSSGNACMRWKCTTIDTRVDSSAPDQEQWFRPKLASLNFTRWTIFARSLLSTTGSNGPTLVQWDVASLRSHPKEKSIARGSCIRQQSNGQDGRRVASGWQNFIPWRQPQSWLLAMYTLDRRRHFIQRLPYQIKISPICPSHLHFASINLLRCSIGLQRWAGRGARGGGGLEKESGEKKRGKKRGREVVKLYFFKTYSPYHFRIDKK